MRTIVLFFLTSFIFNASIAQDPQLFENTWYLENVIIDGENNYPINSTFDGEMNFQADFISLGHSYCESGISGDVIYTGSNQFNLNEVIALVETCDDPDVLQFISKHYSVYVDNNLIAKNPLHYFIVFLGDYKTLTITNPEGKQAIYNSIPLGVQTFENAMFSIYPNPSFDTLNISSTKQVGNLKIHILSLEGKILNTQHIDFNKQTSIDVSNLSSGIYFLKIADESGRVEVKKFVKQ
ncbi:T9SS type A sorting domain-containing protein [Aequorivita sinensis]|uniref:T9SS type A sorting domain-containing protein n=1 Tax=Aequorivita sinensis TaxID=1382458 RepID=UPI00230075CC|nr:T9SS type A sorting domain-containing protein [Aequorivita sinensis]